MNAYSRLLSCYYDLFKLRSGLILKKDLVSLYPMMVVKMYLYINHPSIPMVSVHWRYVYTREMAYVFRSSSFCFMFALYDTGDTIMCYLYDGVKSSISDGPIV
jgi:hypothetical protein